jgi:hypothetical protein
LDRRSGEKDSARESREKTRIKIKISASAANARQLAARAESIFRLSLRLCAFAGNIFSRQAAKPQRLEIDRRCGSKIEPVPLAETAASAPASMPPLSASWCN